jgi:glycosyltransferase involved in cell wall biosynthesis
VPAASVIVPARDAAATIGATLAAATAERPGEIIVVDDGSTDRTAAIAQAAGARVVDGPRTGPGAARNAGAAAASGDVLVFLDADCVPVRGWLEAGLEALEDADLVQGRVDPDPAATRRPFERTLSVPAAYGLFESANLFVRRELFDDLGGFEDWLPGPEVRFGPAVVGEKSLGEDVLFGWRALRAGAVADFSEEALVHHAVFDRTALEYVAERLRLRAFPKMARAVPELRESFFFGGVFLTRRSAAFDAAAAGLLLALLSRRRLSLVIALPYAVLLRRHVRRWPQAPALQVAATYALADAVSLYALGRGSLEARTIVL